MKKIVSLIVVVTTALPLSATADGDGLAREKAKAKIVSRLYQATYGNSKRCFKSTPEASQEFDAELHKFTEKNSVLMKLVPESEYYEPARARFPVKDEQDEGEGGPEVRASECKYLASLLRSMNDTEEGQAVVKGYEALLSK